MFLLLHLLLLLFLLRSLAVEHSVERCSAGIDPDVAKPVLHENPCTVVRASCDLAEHEDLLVFIQCIKTLTELSERDADGAYNGEYDALHVFANV